MSVEKPLDVCDAWATEMAKRLGLPTKDLISLTIDAYAGSPIKVSVVYWYSTEDVPMVIPDQFEVDTEIL